MKILIVGNGAVGDTLIEMVCNEGHNVIVIDSDPEKIVSAVNKYDVLGIVGNGASVNVLKEAGASDCDVIISVSQSDEFNLLCGMIASKLGARHTIVRVRNPAYLDQTNFMSNSLGIDMIVNPEYEAAREAARLIRFPAAMKIDKFAQGRVEVVEIHIGENHPLIHQAISDFKRKYNTNALVCAIRRGEELIIPSGDYVIEEGDTVSLTASRVDITDLFMKIGLLGTQIKNVMIVGGGKVSQYLAATLVQSRAYKVHIVEKDAAVCEELAEQFPGAVIIHGDATDPELLEEEGLNEVDACVIMTSDDKTNLIISMFAQTRNVKKVIVQLTSPSYLRLSEQTGTESNIIPRYLMATKVLRYLRGLSNKEQLESKSGIKSLHRIVENKVEVIEFDVGEDFKLISTPLRHITLKKNVLIAAIIREGAVIYPHGNSTLEVGDSVIVLTANQKLFELGDILA